MDETIVSYEIGLFLRTVPAIDWLLTFHVVTQKRDDSCCHHFANSSSTSIILESQGILLLYCPDIGTGNLGIPLLEYNYRTRYKIRTKGLEKDESRSRCNPRIPRNPFSLSAVRWNSRNSMTGFFVHHRIIT